MKYMKNASIAKYYAQWIKSRPFSIGVATHTALSKLSATDADPNQAKMAALYENHYSQSNGSLMRIAPLTVWSSGLF